MLYLIRPNAAPQWCDLPTSLLDKFPAGTDLARLDWQPSDRQFDDVVLDLALRYGHASSVGIALDAGIVSQRTWSHEIRSAHADAAASRQKLQGQDGLMEKLIPGWIHHGKELDARVDESALRAAANADEELQALLDDAEVRPELVELWTALGGHLPHA